jgi:hypothetical protein
MNRFRVSLGALVAITLSLLATWQIANPRRAEAIDCYCGSLRSTPIVAAKSATSCSQAESKLWTKAYALMDCGFNNTCFPSLVITTECYWDAAASVYRIEGLISYGCYIGSACP